MTRLKATCAILFITSYIGWLSWGVTAHALKVGLCGNTYSYFVVWDMFCGWAAWDTRTHVIALDSQGQYYDVTEPWGEFHPYGHLARIHYDNTHHLLPKHIDHILSNTLHSDIDRVYVIEEVWPKQYNLPPDLYAHYFNGPKDQVSYFHLKAICTDEGTPLTVKPDWYHQQTLNSIADNPRLRKQASRSSGTQMTLFRPVSSRSSNLNTN